MRSGKPTGSYNLLRSPKAICWDLDGVLVDSYEVWRSLLNQGLQEKGKKPLDCHAFDRIWGQGLEADQQMFFPTWSLQEVMAYYERNFPKHLTKLRINPEAPWVLKALKAHGLKLGVASNTPKKLVILLLQQSKLSPWIDVALGVDEVPQGKPAPDLLLACCRRLKVSPQETWYVGDTRIDKEAALKAELTFIPYQMDGEGGISSLREILKLLGKPMELPENPPEDPHFSRG